MNDKRKFISYFETKQYLEVKLHATQDEIAQWVSIGALDAYLINESEQPSLFTFKSRKNTNDDNYLKPLEKLNFLPDDIAHFNPARRYITRPTLIERWVELYNIDDYYGKDDDEYVDEAKLFYNARINESGCSEYHPITGLIESTGQLFRSGLFDINDVQEIEANYNHKKSTGYRTALRYLERKKESDNKVLGECDEDDNIDMDEYELELELERMRVLEELYKSVVSGEVKFSLVPYDEFMGFAEQEPDKKCGFSYRNNNPTIPIEPTAPKYGEPELLLDDAIILALLLLGDWEADELALLVFNGTVRAFEKSPADGMLRPVVNIQDWLIQYGKCVSFDDKQYSIKKALAMFNYSKSELSQFKPRNRYISFQNAIALISGQGTKDIDAAEMYLINVLEQQQIYAFHCFVGHVTPKLSMDGERWRNGYFAEWQLNRLLDQDFGEKKAPRNMHRTKSIEGSREKRNIKTVMVSPVFSKFENLRANEVSLIMLKNAMLKMVIRGKSIEVDPKALRLKHSSQGWMLLERAAIDGGVLTRALNSLNKTIDLETETQKIKTAISRLNKKLMQSMGLLSQPIVFESNEYRFIFNNMNHEIYGGNRTSKGADRMDYIGNKDFDDNKDDSSCWSENEDEDEDENEFDTD